MEQALEKLTATLQELKSDLQEIKREGTVSQHRITSMEKVLLGRQSDAQSPSCSKKMPTLSSCESIGGNVTSEEEEDDFYQECAISKNHKSRQTLTTVTENKKEISVKLTPPERFCGDPKNFRAFKSQCSLHFLAKPSQFDSDQAKVVFTISNLGGDALAWANPIIDGHSPLLQNYQEFFDAFTEVFDRHYAETARGSEFLNLRQGSASLTSYLSKFRQLAFELQWSDSAQFAIFLEGLCDNLKDAFQFVFPFPKTVTDLIQLAIQVDQRIREHKGDLSRSISKKNLSSQVTSESIKANRPWVNLSFPREESKLLEGNVKPFIPSRPSQPRGRLTKDEREFRSKKGLCMYCGQAGHLLKDCPFTKKKITPFSDSSKQTVSTATVKVLTETPVQGNGVAQAQ